MESDDSALSGEEFLYRRVLRTWCQSGTRPARAAFDPQEKQPDGISFSRAKFKRPIEIAEQPTRPGLIHYVSKHRVQDLLDRGIKLQVDPHDPSHVRAVNINSNNRKSVPVQEFMVYLTEHCELLDPSINPNVT